jgi:hypothetical protein
MESGMATYIHITQKTQTYAISSTSIKGFRVRNNGTEWILELTWGAGTLTVANSAEENGRSLLDEMLTQITNSLATMGDRGGTITIHPDTTAIDATTPRSTPQLSRY